MSNIITARIDVTQIEKARLYQGKKGKYLDFVLIPSPNSRYEDTHMIVQSVSAEERKAGIKGPILGNAKELESDRPRLQDSPPAHKRQLTQAPGRAEPDWVADVADDDVPF